MVGTKVPVQNVTQSATMDEWSLSPASTHPCHRITQQLLNATCSPRAACTTTSDPSGPTTPNRLVEFHNHLSPRSCYLRFFNFHPTLSPKEVERFTCVDYFDRLALVAEVDGTLIAVARFDRHEGTTEAEVAFVVADDYQHHGIGSLLLDELLSAARERGITTFLADTLLENHAMLDVFLHAGFDVHTDTRVWDGLLAFRHHAHRVLPPSVGRQGADAPGQPNFPSREATGGRPC